MEKKLFFIDQFEAKNFRRKNETLCKEGSQILKSYFEISSFKIGNIEQFLKLFQNPEAFFKSQVFQASREKFKALIGIPGLSVDTLITLPDRWNELTGALRAFNHSGVSEKYFEINGSELRLNENFENWVLKNFGYFVENPEEQFRLEQCKKLIAIFHELGERLVKDGLMSKEEFAEQMHVPTGGKIFEMLVRVPIGSKKISWGFSSSGFELHPNPRFVKTPRVKKAHTFPLRSSIKYSDLVAEVNFFPGPKEQRVIKQ